MDYDALYHSKLNSFIEATDLYSHEPIEEIYEFKGDLYLMINRDSYSAASSFAAIFKCHNMGMIIGEPTGGTQIFRAHSLYGKLSNSKISANISTAKLYTICYNEPNENITPHVMFSPNPIEMVSQVDPQLQYVKYLIRKIRAAKKN